MKLFNITLIEPPGYAHSQALGEVRTYLADVLRRCGHAVRVSTNSIADNEHNVLLCAHLLPEHVAAELPRHTIIFNSEKLEDIGEKKFFADGAYQRLLARHWVWDYSERNLQHVPHQRADQIPLYASTALRPHLAADAQGPLLFYGAMTRHRRDILDRLDRAGLAVIVAPFGCYGEQRDRLMVGASAILNLHTDDRHRIFEPVRCFHPLSNGIAVISEDFHDEPMFDLFRQSMFVIAGDFVDGVVRLLADRPSFAAEAIRRCVHFAAGDPLPAVRSAVERYLGSSA